MKVTKTDAGLYAVNVDGESYEFERWGAEDSLDCLMDISAIVGGPLASAATAAFGQGGDGLKTELTGDLAGNVVRELTANMRQHKEMVKSICMRLAGRRVWCGGKQVDFDRHYEYRLPHMFSVVRAAFEVQYGNFFDAVLANAGLSRPRKDLPTSQASAA